MTFKEALTEAMAFLAQDERVLFLGQQVAYPGQAVFETLEKVPMEKRIEMPVAEELQLGIAIGLSLQGYVPVCIYPRLDFLMRAMDQLVNHLDKLEEMSRGEFIPKVIIRTAVGRSSPLDPGPQHKQDHTEALSLMLQKLGIVKIKGAADIESPYRMALLSSWSWLIIEAPEEV